MRPETFTPLGKGRYSWSYKRLILLKEGEAIEIRCTDWKTKTPPFETVRTAAKDLNCKLGCGLYTTIPKPTPLPKTIFPALLCLPRSIALLCGTAYERGRPQKCDHDPPLRHPAP